jgi:hypothetical protein
MFLLGLWRRGVAFFLFALFAGIAILGTVAVDHGVVSYVSNGTTVSVNAAGFILLVPLLFTILCAYAVVGMVRER